MSTILIVILLILIFGGGGGTPAIEELSSGITAIYKTFRRSQRPLPTRTPN